VPASFGPDDACHPDHLSGPHLEGGVLQNSFREVLHLQQNLSGRGLLAWKLILDGSADHHAHEL
jgi:hypothetical protein